MKRFANVLVVTLVALITSSTAFGAEWTLSPSVNYYMDKVALRTAMTQQPQASKTAIEKEFAAEGVRAEWATQTGTLAEPNFAASILAGLPQDFLGNYVDWRNPIYATQCARYLVEISGFSPSTTGVIMIQDGYGLATGNHQTFRMFFPAVVLNGYVYAMLDRDYMESVGIAPETTRIIWFTNNVTTYWTQKEPPLHPFPVVTTDSTTTTADVTITTTNTTVPSTSVANTTVTAPINGGDCGCAHDNSGNHGNEKGVQDNYSNKTKCKSKLGVGHKN